MDKKIQFTFCIILMISFCTGIFVEMIAPDNIMFSPNAPGFWKGLWGNIKNDLVSVLLSVFFPLTIYLFPCVPGLVIAKTFALGFSSAYLLSLNDTSMWLLLSLVFTRALLKLPAYVLLTFYAWNTARQIKTAKLKIKPMLKQYSFCLLILSLSSLIEACLLQAVT